MLVEVKRALGPRCSRMTTSRRRRGLVTVAAKHIRDADITVELVSIKRSQEESGIPIDLCFSPFPRSVVCFCFFGLFTGHCYTKNMWDILPLYPTLSRSL